MSKSTYSLVFTDISVSLDKFYTRKGTPTSPFSNSDIYRVNFAIILYLHNNILREDTEKMSNFKYRAISIARRRDNLENSNTFCVGGKWILAAFC